MRIIRFRCWNFEENKMEFPDLSDGWVVCEGEINHRNAPLYPLMQFTGSVDCKWNEIYEGDIVLLGEGFHPRKRPIVFSEYGAWDIGELGVSFGQMKANGFVDCEVIGNIYENPELLTD